MVSAIIQARIDSARLPNKVFADITGKPLLWHVVTRLKRSKHLNSIIIATTTNINDDIIETWTKENNIPCFRGSEDNVLKRYYDATEYFGIDVIVRITADDPFKDYIIMDTVIEKFKSENADIACNNNPPSFPEGLDIEVFSRDALSIANKQTKTLFEKEHVTQYFYHNPDIFKISTISYPNDLSYLRWTIDEYNDLKMARRVYEELFNEKQVFLMDDILALIKKFPDIPKLNDNVNRSTMYK